MRRYSIGEVCDLLDTRAHTLRYWEQEVPVIRPRKDEFGRRSYSEQDIQQLFRLKYLVNERGMTLQGAARALVEDGRPGIADRKAAVRQLRSHMLSLVERTRMVRNRIAQAADAPGLLRDRSDSGVLLRRWKELSQPARTRFLSEISLYPDYWVDHVRRLTAPGRLLREPGSGRKVAGAAGPASMRRLPEKPERGSADGGETPDWRETGRLLLERGKAVLVWWPSDDLPPPSSLPFSLDRGTLVIAVPAERALAWERARDRWVTGFRVRIGRRYPLPCFSAGGELQVDANGRIVQSHSRLAQAISWLTQPHERARLLTEGAVSVGLVLPGSGSEINPAVAALHRYTHASVTARLSAPGPQDRKSAGSAGRAPKLRGVLWFDLAFLSRLTRDDGSGTDSTNVDPHSRVVPGLTMSRLLARAALPQLFY